VGAAPAAAPAVAAAAPAGPPSSWTVHEVIAWLQPIGDQVR
jgi:hypothetical protein